MSDQGAIDRPPVLGEAERRRLLVEWNATEADYPRDRCVHELFEARAARSHDAFAVAFEDKRLTYGQLNARANQLARHLRTAGVEPDTLVAICFERSLEMVVGLLAVLKAGGAYAPLDPAYPAERLAFMLRDAAPRAVLSHGPARGTLEAAMAGLAEAPPILDLDADEPLWAGQPAANPDGRSIGLTSSHLVYVIYTSGSTGTPKGVMVEHRSLVNLLAWTADTYPLDADDILLQKAPIGFDTSAWEIFWPLSGGAQLLMARPQGHKDPRYLAEVIRTRGVTAIVFVPSMLDLFLNDGGDRILPGVRKVCCGGEALTARTFGRFRDASEGVALWNFYGPTEAAVNTTVWVGTPGGLSDQTTNPPIGRPIWNTRIYLLDSMGEPVPIGAAGEIHIGGAGVARGYLNRPELTAERFLASPFVVGDRLYRTGDMGRYLPDGTIEFLGRNDFQVKIRGFRVEPGEIEARLLSHPGVREAVVASRVDGQGDQRLVAYYTNPLGADAPPVAMLREHMLASLPDHMVPSAYVRLEALPPTPNGKLDRNALPAPEASAARGYEAPRGHAEETLARIWAEALRIERVGRHDNFFELGGHSLLAVKVTFEIGKAFGKPLPLRVLFSTPTIAQLAPDLSLAAEEGEGPISLLPLHTSRDGAPIFMIHLIERDLARHLGSRRPVYALSFGLAGIPGDDRQPPHGVEALAAHYIAEMRSIQPHGPYHLAGHSAGGLVAYEMARRLSRIGESVALLALLGTRAVDPTGIRRRLPTPRILRNMIDSSPSTLARKLHKEMTGTRATRGQGLQEMVGNPYPLQPYAGQVDLFVETLLPAPIAREAHPPPATGWEALALGGLEIHHLPGGHMDMVKDPLAALAAEAIERAWSRVDGAASATSFPAFPAAGP